MKYDKINYIKILLFKGQIIEINIIYQITLL